MRYLVAINGIRYEVDAGDAEEAADVAALKHWREQPPGEGDAIDAHVIRAEQPRGEVESFTVTASYRLDALVGDAEDGPADADLAALEVPRGA